MSLDARITNEDFTTWGEKRVNLSAASAKEYREQGNNLRDRLAKYIDANPEFDLEKMLNSGSVAKGTALRTTSDMDVAVYVRRAVAPETNHDLVGWLRDLLRQAYDGIISPDQITSDEASVRIAFKGSGVDVECVAILYDDDPDDYGDLLLRTGKRVRTSIPKHLEFTRKRKAEYPFAFAQYVRFLRFWRNTRAQQGDVTLSTFAVELVAAHLVDGGLDPSNYPQALQAFFSFVAKGGLSNLIAFTDNYSASAVVNDGTAIRIIDPVAAENNVMADRSLDDRRAIVETAKDALDDVTLARTATTKEDAVAAWRGVFGPEFSL